MKILLVEDDFGVIEVLTEALKGQHYLVDEARDGRAGWELATAFSYDLIILDVMLPLLDGISFCRDLRAKGDRTPILLLTALDNSTKKIAGLDAGADDYVVKPFNLEELLARIRVLLRRGSANTTPIIEWSGLSLNPNSCEVSYNGQLLHLTAKEYALIELFLRNSQRIFSQSALLDHLWSFEEPPSENTVRAHIKSLRSKLKKAGVTDLIETIYGLGYKLKSREQHPAEILPAKAEEEGNKEANPASSQQSPEMLSRLASVWERSKGKYSDRILIVEQAVAAIVENSLTQELLQQAQQQAHTLAGSLGSFGFKTASELSRQIEEILETSDTLTRTQGKHLQTLVVGLRKEVEQPLPATLKKPVSQSITIKQQARLLIVDNDIQLAKQIAAEATNWGMQTVIAEKISTAREAIADTRPDIVLLDLYIHQSAENGFELITQLSAFQPPIPVIVFTAQESFADRIKVVRLGGRGFLKKPVIPSQVAEAIAQVLQQSSKPEAKLLIVDDDPQILDILCTLLQPWGFKLALLDNSKLFWETLEQFTPDLLILDVEMPDLNGIELCQVVRNDPHWSDLPILFLSAHKDVQTVEQVFAVGADDYVNKPIIASELIARILNRLERTQILRKFAELNKLKQ